MRTDGRLSQPEVLDELAYVVFTAVVMALVTGTP
jgi:hypothetical protein